MSVSTTGELGAAWGASRRLLALAGLLTWLPRGAWISEAYSSAGVVVATGELPLARWFVMPPAVAWAVWGALVGSLAWLLFRPSRLLAAVVFAAGVVLVYSEAIDEKAYDRLLLLQMCALVWAGTGGGEAGREARVLQVLIFAGIYGSTGWSKLLFEPAWWTGEVLPGHLVDVHFGLRPLGLLALELPWALTFLGWVSVIFEVVFPFAVWIPRVRPALLLVGAAFHVGIYATMNVTTFSLIAIAGYPAMCTGAEWAAGERWLRRGRVLLAAGVATWAGALWLPDLVQAGLGATTGAAWTPPDVLLHARVRSALDAVTKEDPAEVVRTRWGGPAWTRGEGPPVTLLASTSTSGVDARTGLVVLLALAESLPEDLPVRARLVAGAPEALGPSPGAVLWIGPVGHHAPHRGGQTWPGQWGWVLPARGTFLGFDDHVPDWWAARSAVDAMALPGDWGPAGLPDDALVLTDTGPYRSPGRKGDTVDAIDLDQVARVVAALRAYLVDPPAADGEAG